ncbi:hypothetical protein ACJJTC_002413 [Scirpophaga incertulas]
MPGGVREVPRPETTTTPTSSRSPFKSGVPQQRFCVVTRVLCCHYQRDYKDCIEKQQDLLKAAKDRGRRSDELVEGDLVVMKTHVLSNTAKGMTSKFVPKRDGPYAVIKKVSPTTYQLAYPNNRDKIVGKYHISDLKIHARDSECLEVPIPAPINPKRSRGRPHKKP